MSKRLLHAQHNETVCNSLCSLDSNADWIVTTAFYAALHFLEHKRFPYNHRDSTGSKIRLRSFDEYYGLFHPQGRPNKHAVRLKLAEEENITISAAYKWLKDTCWTARYTDYKFSNNQTYINTAKRRLQTIKEYCDCPAT